MMVAASMGATAFQKGLGAVHAISHPISAVHGVHHGLANAFLLPYVLKFNRPAIEEKMTRLGRHLGLDDPSFGGVQAWLLDLRRELHIPHRFADIGVTGGDADRVAAAALKDPTAATNPMPLDEAVLKRIFLDCVAGNL
jgi:alcohol dehydrogenase class IV